MATLAYHEIFDYPLTKDEIHKYLIGKKASTLNVKKELKNLVKKNLIGEQQGFYFLNKKLIIVKTRSKRVNYSKHKLQKAYLYSKILKIVPTIRFLAISGALAMENSHKDDDIDFFIITKKDTLWTTRFFANILLWPFKRDPHGKNVSDRACLNMFLDESALKIKEQNIYTAHEIAQMKLLWDRGGTYQKLIKANEWVKKYLPNWKVEGRGPYSNKKLPATNYILQSVEKLLRIFQLSYMRSKITAEKIGDKQLFFHSHELGKTILIKYENKLQKLHLLDNPISVLRQ